MKTRFVTVLLATLLLAACASVTNPVTGQRELTVMDEKAEIAEGAKAHQEVIKEYGVVQDAALQAYVAGVGHKLAAASHRAQLKWSFTVLDSPEINALSAIIFCVILAIILISNAMDSRAYRRNQPR